MCRELTAGREAVGGEQTQRGLWARGTLALHDAKSVTARLEITALRTLREG